MTYDPATYDPAYRRAEYLRNKEKSRLTDAARYTENKDVRNAQSAEWRANNRERTNEIQDAWRKRNPSKCVAMVQKRNALKREQCCDCCSKEVFEEIYDFASVAGLHVDHIRPLSKKGLHCQLNLQLLSPEANLSKGASWDGTSGVGI